MILSRGKSSSAQNSRVNVIANRGGGSAKRTPPQFEEFLVKRDYTGALAYLKFKQEALQADETNPDQQNITLNLQQFEHWKGFLNFHLGDYPKALEQYQQLLRGMMVTDNLSTRNVKQTEIGDVQLNVAICMFYLGLYEEAQQSLSQLEKLRTDNKSPYQRLDFHLAFKLNDDESGGIALEMEKRLLDTIEDRLSLASMYYMRAHYQDAIEIYKKLLKEHKEFTAINVYLALCFYKLDYYDMSQEVLDVYLKVYPLSTIATNLKACNRFRLFSGRIAEQEIKNLATASGTFGGDLIRHNLVVFQNGDGALQVLPSLLSIIPEARLNLAIYHLRQHRLQDAYELIKDLQQPIAPHEYILLGVIYAALGQQNQMDEHLVTAQRNFHLVGNSATECDTIPGRQSMASAFFLNGQFEEVLVYLNSIRSYFVNDDTFNYNYAQAKCATGYYREAEELLLQITNANIKKQHSYLMVLATCHIHSARPEMAWNIFINRESSDETFLLLQLIANECYRCEEYWVAAKAFDMLEKLDPSPENWEGKRGACIGVLYNWLSKSPNKGRPSTSSAAVTQKSSPLNDIITLLRNSSNPQADTIIKTLRKHVAAFK